MGWVKIARNYKFSGVASQQFMLGRPHCPVQSGSSHEPVGMTGRNRSARMFQPGVRIHHFTTIIPSMEGFGKRLQGLILNM
jgi:hypothetical protein